MVSEFLKIIRKQLIANLFFPSEDVPELLALSFASLVKVGEVLTR